MNGSDGGPEVQPSIVNDNGAWCWFQDERAPLRRDVVGCALELDLLTSWGLDTEPITVLTNDVSAGEFGVERADRGDVCRVEDGQVQASRHSHGHILPQPTDMNARRLQRDDRLADADGVAAALAAICIEKHLCVSTA